MGIKTLGDYIKSDNPKEIIGRTFESTSGLYTYVIGDFNDQPLLDKEGKFKVYETDVEDFGFTSPSFYNLSELTHMANFPELIEGVNAERVSRCSLFPLQPAM